MSAAICLTPEQRRDYIARFVSPQTPRLALVPPASSVAMTGREHTRWRNEDEITAWLLAWPHLNDREISEATNSERGHVSYVRRRAGIPSVFARYSADRRAKMTKLVAAGWTYTEIGELLGISRVTVAGIMLRIRRGR